MVQGRNRQLVLRDPTAALAEELPLIPPGGLPARDFCDALVAALPVLDGGRISEFMRQERAVTGDARGDAIIGPAFSLALHRLQRRVWSACTAVTMLITASMACCTENDGLSTG